MPTPLGDQARALRERARTRVAARLAQIREIPLSIPVLGPGSTGGALYDERARMRDDLRLDGHYAFFPEEEVGGSDPLGIGFSVDIVEDALFEDADLIVMILTPGGAAHELEQIASNRDRASNTMVFIEQAAKSSYAASGVLQRVGSIFAGLTWYVPPDDLVNGTLIKSVRDEVLRRQETKFRMIQNAKNWKVDC